MGRAFGFGTGHATGRQDGKGWLQAAFPGDGSECKGRWRQGGAPDRAMTYAIRVAWFDQASGEAVELPVLEVA